MLVRKIVIWIVIVHVRQFRGTNTSTDMLLTTLVRGVCRIVHTLLRFLCNKIIDFNSSKVIPVARGKLVCSDLNVLPANCFDICVTKVWIFNSFIEKMVAPYAYGISDSKIFGLLRIYSRIPAPIKLATTKSDYWKGF